MHFKTLLPLCILTLLTLKRTIKHMDNIIDYKTAKLKASISHLFNVTVK